MLDYTKLYSVIITNIIFKHRWSLYHYIAEDTVHGVARGLATGVGCIHMVFTARTIAAVERNTVLDLGVIDVAKDAFQQVAGGLAARIGCVYMIAPASTVAAVERNSAYKLNGMDVAEHTVQRVAGGLAPGVGGVHVVVVAGTAVERNGAEAAQDGQSNHGEVGIPGARNRERYPLDILAEHHRRAVRQQRGDAKYLAVPRRRERKRQSGWRLEYVDVLDHVVSGLGRRSPGDVGDGSARLGWVGGAGPRAEDGFADAKHPQADLLECRHDAGLPAAVGIRPRGPGNAAAFAIRGGLEGRVAENAPGRVAEGAGRAGRPPGLGEDGGHGLGIARPQALVGLRELAPAPVLLHPHVKAV